MALKKNYNAKTKRDATKHKKSNGKPPRGKEIGHGKGGVRKTSKTKSQSVSENRKAGGKAGSKAGKAKGGAKSSRKGVPNGQKKPRNYKQEKKRQRATGYAPRKAKR